MAENSLRLFGFEITRSKNAEQEDKKLKSIVPKIDDDGAGYVTSTGAHYGQYIDIHGDKSKDNSSLIQKYRGVSMHPEVDAALEDIVNEAIVGTDDAPIEVQLDKLEVSDKIKNLMTEEFNNILQMLKFNELGHDIFKRWYIDGRIVYHLVVNESNVKTGIADIRPIDSAKIRKVKEVKKKKDPQTGANIIEATNEYYIYQEKPEGQQNSGVKLTNDSVVYITSGLLDSARKSVVSHLHKALKPINQLRMMEDSLVIYRLARAPERRIFYVDIGNLPKGKAEEYMKDLMSKYRNKLVYDASTQVPSKMIENICQCWKTSGCHAERVVEVLKYLPYQGGSNLGEIDDIIYFQKRLYRSLNVPVNRLEQEQQFSLGRSTEINRDEIKFQKFIDRLRKRFSMVFREILKKQLILKGIITEDDWEDMYNDIQFNYSKDNHFSELKDAEILRERLQTLGPSIIICWRILFKRMGNEKHSYVL